MSEWLTYYLVGESAGISDSDGAGGKRQTNIRITGAVRGGGGRRRIVWYRCKHHKDLIHYSNVDNLIVFGEYKRIFNSD